MCRSQFQHVLGADECAVFFVNPSTQDVYQYRGRRHSVQGTGVLAHIVADRRARHFRTSSRPIPSSGLGGPSPSQASVAHLQEPAALGAVRGIWRGESAELQGALVGAVREAHGSLRATLSAFVVTARHAHGAFARLPFDDTAVAAMGLMCTRLSCVVEALSTHANLVDVSLNESEAMSQLVSEMSGNGNASPHPLPSEAKPTDKTNMKLGAIKGNSLSGSGGRSRRRSLTLESHSGKAC